MPFPRWSKKAAANWPMSELQQQPDARQQQQQPEQQQQSLPELLARKQQAPQLTVPAGNRHDPAWRDKIRQIVPSKCKADTPKGLERACFAALVKKAEIEYHTFLAHNDARADVWRRCIDKAVQNRAAEALRKKEQWEAKQVAKREERYWEFQEEMKAKAEQEKAAVAKAAWERHLQHMQMAEPSMVCSLVRPRDASESPLDYYYYLVSYITKHFYPEWVPGKDIGGPIPGKLVEDAMCMLFPQVKVPDLVVCWDNYASLKMLQMWPQDKRFMQVCVC